METANMEYNGINRTFKACLHNSKYNDDRTLSEPYGNDEDLEC